MYHQIRCWQFYASIVFEPIETKREAGALRTGLDWGNETFATLAIEDGTYEEIPNPRNGRKAAAKLKRAKQSLASKKKGSKNREKARKKLQRAYKNLRDTRKDFLHQESNKLVKRFCLIVAESLSVQSMTQAGEDAGERGRNREALDTAPSAFYGMLRYKAEEAGSVFSETETKRYKPTQACSGCGTIVPKELSERIHQCRNCGLCIGRDENASRACLNVGLWGSVYDPVNGPFTGSYSGRGPTVCLAATGLGAGKAKQESPSILAP